MPRRRNVTLLSEYEPPPYLAPEVRLVVSLDAGRTVVTNETLYVRSKGTPAGAPLFLDGATYSNGAGQELLSVEIDGAPAGDDRAVRTDGGLVVRGLPERSVVTVRSACRPSANRSGQGLYTSGPSLVTQMEAEGFRTFTFFQDRPDVMSRYRVRLEGDPARYSLLLSNGHLTAAGAAEGGRHFAEWDDPFPKPCYLFAVVAGAFDVVSDTFVTSSGKKVLLEVFTDPGESGRAGHALASLVRAMTWDEETYGLEYDLDRFMIVAAKDFNMGAMENKGLNVFNAKYVLADAESATDQDFERIESIVAHEYFHNWTGNRVTCRDWFQLTLKEGLTVYRDQEFSADVGSRAVKRIEEVRTLRSAQFPEDAGPNAHPVRPDRYVEIDNFYTATVYRKGAEVVRMAATLLGREVFRRGIDRYFELFDGQAVTCEDFVRALSEASGRDLSRFFRWYSQVGTPVVSVTRVDAAGGTTEVTVTQLSTGTPDGGALVLPFAVGFVGPDGRDLPVVLEGEEPGRPAGTRVLEADATRRTFRFTGVPPGAIGSWFRDFSAPVDLRCEYSAEENEFLARREPDPWNRYEAGQRILRAALARDAGDAETRVLARVFRGVLEDADEDPAYAAEFLSLPSLDLMVAGDRVIDYGAADARRERVAALVTGGCEEIFRRAYAARGDGPDSAGRRALRNTCLTYLVRAGVPDAADLLFDAYDRASTMTEADHAVRLACAWRLAPDVARRFYDRWRGDAVVIDKWFSSHAGARPLPEGEAVAKAVARLEDDPAYDRQNPNKLLSLLGGFSANALAFHAEDGGGYRFLASRIREIDRFNPLVASRLAKAFHALARLDPARAAAARDALTPLVTSGSASPGVYEVVSNTLGLN